MRRAFVALLALALTLVPSAARAEDPPEGLPTRSVTFSWDKTLLRASFGYRDVVDKALTAKLSSGLPTVIALRAYVLREGDASPVALAIRSCRIVYDLWDEVYRIRVTSSGGDRDVAGLNVEGVLRQCADVREMPIADKTLLAVGKAHYLGVIVEVNPVSPQMLAEMRRWVSRPAGSTGIGPGDALFGSFVALFVQKLGTADRTLRFRSATFTP